MLAPIRQGDHAPLTIEDFWSRALAGYFFGLAPSVDFTPLMFQLCVQ